MGDRVVPVVADGKYPVARDDAGKIDRRCARRRAGTSDDARTRGVDKSNHRHGSVIPGVHGPRRHVDAGQHTACPRRPDFRRPGLRIAANEQCPRQPCAAHSRRLRSAQRAIIGNECDQQIVRNGCRKHGRCHDVAAVDRDRYVFAD